MNTPRSSLVSKLTVLSIAAIVAAACSGGSDGSDGNASSNGATSSGASTTSGGPTTSTTSGVTGVGGGPSTSGSTAAATTGLATSGTIGGVGGNGAGGMSGVGGESTSSAGGSTNATTSDGSTGGMGGSMAGSTGAGGASMGGAGGTGGAGGFNPCPTAAGSECAVLPLGDSITEGCCTQPYGGYRIELFRQAFTNQKGITFVGSLNNGPTTVDGQPFPSAHQGHGGYTIDSDGGHSGISGMITQNALQNYDPNIVLLMIGTNDINGNVDINNAPNRLANLIDDIITRAPDALLVVSAIIPTTNDGTNQRVEAYNAAIPPLIEERAGAGKHVVFLDMYTAFSQNASYKTALMADGLHPNDAGYVVLGQSFYGVIGDLLPAAQ